MVLFDAPRPNDTRLSRMYKLLREFAVEVFFFLQVASRKKGKNSSTDELHTRFAVEIFFSPKSRSSQESEGYFFRRATYKVTYVEAVEFRQGWSVATRRGREKEEKKTTKEGGLSPQEGDLEKVQEKKKTKEGEKVAPRRKGSVCPQPRNFFFWFTSIWVLRDPSRLMYRLLRDLDYEEAICEGSSGNGLSYPAKAVP